MLPKARKSDATTPARLLLCSWAQGVAASGESPHKL